MACVAKGKKLISEILPDFQEFLLSHQLVTEKNIPFYALWVSKFISFMNGNRDIAKDAVHYSERN